ncbi:MAG: hypothetical protein SGBAC_005862, partial [Bacillariaceae sp.]
MSKDCSFDGRSFGSWDDDVLSETMVTVSNNDETNERMEAVGKRETRHLEVFKTVFLGLLLVATVLISWTVYSITESGEDKQFENHFQDQAARLLQEFSMRFSNAIAAIHSFDVTIISHVRSMDVSWPFAHVPEFDIRAESILAISNAKFLSYIVKVAADGDKGRVKFESYVQNNSDWVQEAYDRLPESHRNNRYRHRHLQSDGSQGIGIPSFNNFNGDIGDSATSGLSNIPATGNMVDNNDEQEQQQMYDNMTGDNATTVFPTIFTFEEAGPRFTSAGSWQYYPVLQCHPVAPHLINYDLFGNTVFGQELERSSANKSIVVGRMVLPRTLVPAPNRSAFDNITITTPETNGITTDDGTIPPNNNDTTNISDSSAASLLTEGHNRRQLSTMVDSPQPPGDLPSQGQDGTVYGKADHGLRRYTDQYIQFIYQQQPGNGPFSQVILPIFDKFSEEDDNEIVGFVAAYFFWSDFLAEQLPDTVDDVICVLQNECNEAVSFEINSNRKATYLGEGDYHDRTYDNLVTSFGMQDIANA